MSIADRIRIRDVRLLSDNWYVLKTTTFDWRRGDGVWQTSSRETYDRGNGATLLPYSRRLGTVLLSRQFRYPAYVNGYDGLMIEAAAGLLDAADPEARIRAEVEEEIGYRLGAITKVFECFMSPGSVTEKLYFFLAEYEAHAGERRWWGRGGGGGCRTARIAVRRGDEDDRDRRDRRRQDDYVAAVFGFARDARQQGQSERVGSS